MKTVIMAGGLGTRIAGLFPELPKPMIPIGGKPVLEREFDILKAQGFTDFLLTVGYKKDVIRSYFGDGSAFGISIEYFEEDVPLGNAGALFRLREKLTEDFLLLNVDSVFDVDLQRFRKYHEEKGGLATLFAHPNSHPYDSGLLIPAEDGSVERWLTKEEERPRWYRNLVNAGLHILSPEVIDLAAERMVPGEFRKIDLDRDLLKPLAGTGKLFAYRSPEYVKDMGTPERFEAVSRDVEAGIPAQRNLRHPQKAVFLDRDGVINREVGFLHDPEEFELLPWAAENIRKINESGYLAVVVTNQPVIARGEMTFEELELTHRRMETELGKEGAYLDAVYFCPHHPDAGFPGEVKALKIECSCRKPKPGMLLRAAEDWNIDLSDSLLIGDSDRDILAGKAAGLKKNRKIETNMPWRFEDLFRDQDEKET